MRQYLIDKWGQAKAWFSNSETILWARIQVAFGVVMAVLPTLNPMSWLDSSLSKTQRWVLALTAIANGLWTEYLRRRNATDLTPLMTPPPKPNENLKP